SSRYQAMMKSPCTSDQTSMCSSLSCKVQVNSTQNSTLSSWNKVNCFGSHATPTAGLSPAPMVCGTSPSTIPSQLWTSPRVAPVVNAENLRPTPASELADNFQVVGGYLNRCCGAANRRVIRIRAFYFDKHLHVIILDYVRKDVHTVNARFSID